MASITFPGIGRIFSAELTLSHGVSPGECLYRIMPPPSLGPLSGNLVLEDGPLVRTLTGWTADLTSLRHVRGDIWTVRVLDRRWKWPTAGTVSGDFNVRLPDGDIDPDTEQTPQQLLTLLMVELGELVFDVTLVPNQSRPEVHWDHALPHLELDRLCNLLGCRIALGLDDTVRIWPLGMGAELPAGRQITLLRQFIPGGGPDALQLVAAPIVFLSKLLLEAVGEEANGRIRPIADLSYKPATGWLNESLDTFANVAETSRHLALKTVFRWYRVKQQAHGGLDPPGWGNLPVLEVDQYHLLADLPLPALNPDGNEIPRQPYLEGVYWPEGPDYANTVAGTRYRGDWTIDADRHLVKTACSVVRLDSDGTHIEPELYLYIGYLVSPEVSGPPQRWIIQRNLPVNPQGTGAHVTRADDLVRHVIGLYNNPINPVAATGLLDNGAALQLEVDRRLDQIQAGFLPRVVTEAIYGGLRNINLDGAIQQVSWYVGIERQTQTRASRNDEFSIHSVPARQRQHLLRSERTAEAAGVP